MLNRKLPRLAAAAAVAAAGLALAAFGPGAGLARAKAPDAGRSYRVPYRLTDTNHFLVRVRIDGKGPFNFLVDTGAPLLFVSTDTARKVGLDVPADRVWAPIERLDFEGGAHLLDLKAVVEDPFQLVGMNALGLPGASIDGILGYSVLARFRIELDPTRDRMTWTRLDFDPRDPLTLRSKKAQQPAELQAMNMMGPMAKLLAAVVGKQPEERLETRGSLGIELSESSGVVSAAAVHAGSPAEAAGVRAGDIIESLAGRPAPGLAEARAAVAEVRPGDPVPLVVRRQGADGTIELTLTAGRGL